MLHLTLLALTLPAGVVKEPFRVADHEPTHSQILVRTAMAPDGRFAIAWIDSLATVIPDIPRYELYIRFFDSGGSPTTPAQKIAKLADTNWIYWPAIDMDSSGNAVLLWEEAAHLLSPSKKLRFQRFDRNGSLSGAAQTVADTVSGAWWGGDVACNAKGEFAVAWYTVDVWLRRYSANGTPQDSAYVAHDSLTGMVVDCPMVEMSNAGDLVATWREGFETSKVYPRFQGFDSNDDPILPWQPKGYRLDDSGDWYDGSRSEVHWLDNDRFLAFWVQIQYQQITGRVFSGRGATRHSIASFDCSINDTLFSASNYAGQFSSSALPDGHFAITYLCFHTEMNPQRTLDHPIGIVGKVESNTPVLTTEAFNYSHPYGADTIWRAAGSFSPQSPAVAASGDRIVWVYSRLNTDTIWEAWATITDWDMSAIAEPPPSSPVTHPVTPVTHFNSVGREIILHYSDSPHGFHASIYDASGRRLDELQSPNQNGILIWGPHQNPGVYFIVPDGSKVNPLKVVLVR